MDGAVLAVDPRIVRLRYPANHGIVRDWESRAKLDWNCSWSMAEELVRKQHNNKNMLRHNVKVEF